MVGLGAGLRPGVSGRLFGVPGVRGRACVGFGLKAAGLVRVRDANTRKDEIYNISTSLVWFQVLTQVKIYPS